MDDGPDSDLLFQDVTACQVKTRFIAVTSGDPSVRLVHAVKLFGNQLLMHQPHHENTRSCILEVKDRFLVSPSLTLSAWWRVREIESSLVHASATPLKNKNSRCGMAFS